MAYSAFSVTFGEQPSPTKWNILGNNDASFRDGTGLLGNNDQYISSQNSSGVKTGILKIGANDIMQFSEIPYDDDGSTVTKSDILVQTGWGYIQGNNTSAISEAVTFPVSYTEILGVITTQAGSKGSAPSGYDDDDGTSNEYHNHSSSDALTTSGFTLSIISADSNNLSSSKYYIYSWWAWGSK